MTSGLRCPMLLSLQRKRSAVAHWQPGYVDTNYMLRTLLNLRQIKYRLFTQSTAVVGHCLIVLVGRFREIGVTIFARDKVIVVAVRWVGDSQ